MKTNYKKSKLLILATGLCLLITGQLFATDYYTVQDGNWNNSNTWQNGQKPPEKDIPSSANIYIRHTVNRNSNDDLKNDGLIHVEPITGTTAKLILKQVNVYNQNNGIIKVIDGYWQNYRFNGGGDSGQSRNGNFYNSDDAYLEVINGVMETAQNWKNEKDSKAYYENSCILMGENYQVDIDKITGSHFEIYKNSNISLGWHGSGNFQQDKGKIDYDGTRIQLAGTSGNFQLSDGEVDGSITLITFKNHDNNNVGGGEIQTSSSISGTTDLDYYWAQNAGKLDDQGNVFTGNKTFQDITSQYFPNDCGPGSSPECDVAITKVASNSDLEPGDTFTYTLTVTNNGPSTAAGVTVTDVIPNELTVLGNTPSTGSWSAPTWTVGSLINGDSETLTFNIEVNSGVSGNVTNTSTASSTTTDTNPNNNTDSAIITVSLPNDTIINYFPATGYGTLAYEDLWPGKGDYDFNNLVMDYKFKMLSNTQNYIFQITGTFIIKAFGATYENGFGFQLSDDLDQSDINVSGYNLTENYITLGANGLESGQSKPTIIVYDNTFNQMAHPGTGIGVNTTPGAPYVDPDTLVITST